MNNDDSHVVHAVFRILVGCQFLIEEGFSQFSHGHVLGLVLLLNPLDHLLVGFGFPDAITAHYDERKLLP